MLAEHLVFDSAPHSRFALFFCSFFYFACSNKYSVLVTFEDALYASTPDLWPASTIINSYANSDDLDTMEAFNAAEVCLAGSCALLSLSFHN